MSDDDLSAVYFEEAGEVLSELEEVLLLLESLPDDRSLIDRLFRAAHTLKGSSAVFGFDRVAGFTHHVEDLIDALRDAGATVTRSLTDALLQASDIMKSLVAEAGGGERVADQAMEAVLARLQTVGEKELGLGAAAPPATQASAPTPQAPLLTETLVLTPEAASPESPAAEPKATVAQPAAKAEPSPAAELDQAQEPAQEAEARTAGPGKANADALSVRVPIEKLEQLVNLVGEIVITQSMIAQRVASLPPSELVDSVVAMGRHCRELQERVLGVRMLPVKTLFGRFQRLVRDTASAIGKRVELVTSGEETELDKTVIEKIGDPLTHILRNSIDHGIESPEERHEAGKSEVGRVTLSACQRGGCIFIEVNDDGRGLDRKKILARARERGLVGPETPSDDEIDQLIFLPGFSTAEKVTELSGRGVGMDVVRRNVDALQGTITLTSTPGVGMRIQIKLPLTLAILEGLVLGVGAQTFVAPLVAVVECLHPKPDQVRSVLGAGQVLDLRGEHLPLVPLAEAFHVERREGELARSLVVVLDDGSARMAILVDELLGQSQVVVKSLEANVGRVPGIAGATILGDGSVALIIDAAGLAALWRQCSRSAAPSRLTLATLGASA